MAIRPAAAQQSTAGHIEFRRDVLPILSGKCFPCHGPDSASREANLRLDRSEFALRSQEPVIIPGDSRNSELVRRIFSVADDRMPPPGSNRQLTAREQAILINWVEQGAGWDEHWAFQPVRRPPLPDPAGSRHPQHPIDAFVISTLQLSGRSSAEQADPAVLLRRVTLDLTGLPPTASDVTSYLTDTSPDRYEKAVDRLLASPQFGEHWGRHWLDAARFADSTGFETDAPKPMWKYRDWVIQAVNQDLPFDQFVIRQLAGDLLPEGSQDDRVATGFLLCGPQDGGSEPARLDAVVERVNTIGSVFLGLTFGCAQCHSHKFDPLTQEDYYKVFAFFNSADEQILEFAAADDVARRDALKAQLAALTKERMEYQISLNGADVKSDPGYQERTRVITELEQRIPGFPSTSILVAAVPARSTTVFLRGDYSEPGPAVEPDVPSVLPPLPAGSRTRLQFAQWLVSQEHPLTSRVTVNRIWQQLFGRGLVVTEDDFGTQGTPPTHPELLDWLAEEFRSRNWSAKAVIRLIVTSSTYQQSSSRIAEEGDSDPDNLLISRQSRIRLDAEVIRDSALQAAGLLQTAVGGPSVFPVQADGILVNRATPAVWNVSEGADRHRRTLYTHFWRLTPHPFLLTFDAPDSLTACTRRQKTNTPLQSLTLLNDPIFVECAEALGRQLSTSTGDDSDRIHTAFLRCVGREPDAVEVEILANVLADARQRFSADAVGTLTPEAAAWTQAVRALLNSDEFVTRE